MASNSTISNSTTLANSQYASTSLIPLPLSIRNGMIAMGTMGLLSTLATSGLLLFITYRMVYWRRFYDHSIAKNQVFILLYNLLLADFQQAASFLFPWRWIAINELVGPSPTCFAQGWLIQIGDVSSGLWVLAIAVHTFNSLVIQKSISMPVFTICVVSLWMFALFLTALGPIMAPHDFFIPAGAWCWMNPIHEKYRLYLHYLWIFTAQLGSLVIYSIIFFHLRMRLASSGMAKQPDPSSSSSNGTADPGFHKGGATGTVTTVAARPDPFAKSRKRILKTARYMVVYPIAYIALTLPLAAGRVAAMAGHEPALSYFPVAGTLMSSCGFVDVLLYIYTRKALIQSTVERKGSADKGDAKVRGGPNSGVMMNNMRDGTAEENIGYRSEYPGDENMPLGELPVDQILIHQNVSVMSQSDESLARETSNGNGVILDGLSVHSTSDLVNADRRKGSKDLKFWAN
jgi:hypothetical protein